VQYVGQRDKAADEAVQDKVGKKKKNPTKNSKKKQ
jgi:hypothetical protein